jgi:hypothetical protein
VTVLAFLCWAGVKWKILRWSPFLGRAGGHRRAFAGSCG